MEGGVRWGRLGAHPNRCRGPGGGRCSGRRKRGEGGEGLTCLSRLLFLESDFRRSPGVQSKWGAPLAQVSGTLKKVTGEFLLWLSRLRT